MHSGNLVCNAYFRNANAKFFIIIYLFVFGCAGLRYCLDFSLVVASQGYSPVVVCGLLIAVASLVAEHGL